MGSCGNTASKVLIVEEHPVTRWGLQHFLETTKDIRIVGEASCLAEAFDQIQRHDPDVIIMDIVFPDGDGIEAVREIMREKPRCVLAFSAHDTWDCVQKFVKAGGLGFVTKRCPPDELLCAIEAVSRGRRWISPSVRRVGPAPARRSGDDHSRLSPREIEVAALVARGLTSRQIADQLCVSLKTIETHRYRIFKGLQIKSRAQLVNYAIRHGLLGNYASESSGAPPA
ncbi:MAG: response regulator transcription factor [Armatimonadetes bacterium]|nr:response regulator transcription factor [Armatimonadota bacterium]